MTLSARERSRLVWEWRKLVNAVLTGDREAVRLARGHELASPFDDPARSFALYAFGRMSWATVKAAAGRRAQMAAAAVELAQLAGLLLAEAGPVPLSGPAVVGPSGPPDPTQAGEGATPWWVEREA